MTTHKRRPLGALTGLPLQQFIRKQLESNEVVAEKFGKPGFVQYEKPDFTSFPSPFKAEDVSLERTELKKKVGPHTLKPMTDTLIEQKVRREFAAFPEVLAAIDNAGRNVVPVWRTRYHKGRLAAGTPGKPSFKPPTVVSFPYNEHGEAINPKSHAVLTVAEKTQLAFELGIHDRRFPGAFRFVRPSQPRSS